MWPSIRLIVTFMGHHRPYLYIGLHFFFLQCMSVTFAQLTDLDIKSILDELHVPTLPPRSNYCRNNDHVIGHWEITGSSNNNTLNKKKFLCCSWDYNDFMWNPTVCENENAGFFHGSQSKMKSSGGHACTCDAKEGR
jgi:hypothetical protein